MTHGRPLPRDLDELEALLARPRPELVEDLAELDGDILVLGAGGKLGPSLVRLALNAIREAGTATTVTAASRFSEPGLADSLRDAGAVVHVADVNDDADLAGLPDVANVLFLVGAKFGTSGQEHATWAANAYLPGRVAARFRDSRIVSLSTGNVYPFVPPGRGATEDVVPAPVGEYAMSCLGRERVLTNASVTRGTPMALIRLNYAVETRYGVLVDIAQAVWAGEPVDVGMGYLNTVWQGYSNEVTIRALRYVDSPPRVLNLTGPETVSVRRAAQRFGEIFGREAIIVGEEAPTALLSDATTCHGLFGYPDVSLDELIEMVAAWTASELPTHGKPTKFQQRDGKF